MTNLLDDSAPIHLYRQLTDLTFHPTGQYLLLRLVTVLKKLLNHVVAKDICHELQSVWLNLAEDAFLFVAVGGFELQLDESRAMLITTELYNMVVNVL